MKKTLAIVIFIAALIIGSIGTYYGNKAYSAWTATSRANAETAEFLASLCPKSRWAPSRITEGAGFNKKAIAIVCSGGEDVTLMPAPKK